MFKHKTVKKSLILLVAALMCVAVLLAACSEKPFTPVTKPDSGEIDSNGGIAVRYGEWIYYVNGYESSVNADNTYVDVTGAPRVGSVVRIKAADLATILEINDKDELTSTQKSKDIAQAVREKAETVVPKIYFSANTTNAYINGIHIFNDRIYILTPNEKLTANGDKQTNQAVLMSFDLAGGDMQRHFTFASNSVQLWLTETSDKKVIATYLDGSELHVLEVAADEKGTDVALKNGDDEVDTISSVTYDEQAQCLFFIDGDGSICKLSLGSKDKDVIVNNAVEDGEDDSTLSYTIKSVSNGYVYFTRADSDNPDVDNLVLYYASSTDKVTKVGDEPKVALNTANVTAYGWVENKVVIVRQIDSGYYGLYLISNVDGSDPDTLLKAGFNADPITINKIVGDELYYTAGGVTYKKNLKTYSDQELGTPYATGWSMSASIGWAAPDVVTVGDKTYMFTLASGSVSVVEFDAVKKTNGTSTALTLTAKPNED